MMVERPTNTTTPTVRIPISRKKAIKESRTRAPMQRLRTETNLELRTRLPGREPEKRR
jgi:hypothetical protein